MPPAGTAGKNSRTCEPAVQRGHHLATAATPGRTGIGPGFQYEGGQAGREGEVPAPASAARLRSSAVSTVPAADHARPGPRRRCADRLDAAGVRSVTSSTLRSPFDQGPGQGHGHLGVGNGQNRHHRREAGGSRGRPWSGLFLCANASLLERLGSLVVRRRRGYSSAGQGAQGGEQLAAVAGTAGRGSEAGRRAVKYSPPIDHHLQHLTPRRRAGSRRRCAACAIGRPSAASGDRWMAAGHLLRGAGHASVSDQGPPCSASCSTRQRRGQGMQLRHAVGALALEAHHGQQVAVELP